jgi:hypothetical protein
MDNKEIQKKAAPHTPKIQKAAVSGTLKRVGGFIILTSSFLENHIESTIKLKADGKEMTAVVQKHGLGNNAILSDNEDLLSLFSNGDHEVSAVIY